MAKKKGNLPPWLEKKEVPEKKGEVKPGTKAKPESKAEKPVKKKPAKKGK